MVQLFLLYGIHLFSLLNGQCQFGALDLSTLPQNIQCVWENDPYQTMQFSRCSSNLQCTWNDLQTYMVIQNSLSGSCQAGIAKFEDDSGGVIQPSRTTVDGKNAYKFEYSNGQASFSCFEPRVFELTFVCDPSATLIDEYSALCGEDISKICAYYMTIYTNLACAGEEDANTGLSTGSLVLVLLFVFIILYCVIGYVFNGMRNPDKDWTDFQYNTPNLSFWKTLPKWIFAGCSVTREWVSQKIGKDGGEDDTDGYDHLDNE